MSRLILAIAIFASMLRGEDPDELIAAAASPYSLAKYVETHSDFDDDSLWKRLTPGLKEWSLPRCDDFFRGIAPCSCELITVVDPFQVIAVVESKFSKFQTILKYQRDATDSWRITGVYDPYVKYFKSEHTVLRFGEKPFLVVTGQGMAGTGLSSTIDYWIDLTQEDLDPDFSFTSKGHYSPQPDGIQAEVMGLVSALESGPKERITVSFDIDFQAIQRGEKIADLGRRDDTVVYERTSDGYFDIVPPASTASSADVDMFYEGLADSDTDVTPADFVRFNLKGLTRVARTGSAEARAWLSSYLTLCPGTPESIQLNALLAQAPR
jgi:hypothetical protein